MDNAYYGKGLVSKDKSARSHYKAMASYKSLVDMLFALKLGNGKGTKFWEDVFVGDKSLKNLFARHAIFILCSLWLA